MQRFIGPRYVSIFTGPIRRICWRMFLCRQVRDLRPWKITWDWYGIVELRLIFLMECCNRTEHSWPFSVHWWPRRIKLSGCRKVCVHSTSYGIRWLRIKQIIVRCWNTWTGSPWKQFGLCALPGSTRWQDRNFIFVRMVHWPTRITNRIYTR